MASGTRNIRMLINQDCFAFLADAMCEYSKKTTKFQSLRSTVQHACVSTKSLALEREDLERFIAEHPFDGKIRVWLEVKPDWLADYDAIRRKNRADQRKTSAGQGGHTVRSPPCAGQGPLLNHFGLYKANNTFTS